MSASFLKKIVVWLIVSIMVFGGFIYALYWYTYTLPYTPVGVNPLEIYIDVPSGSNATSVGVLLEEKGVIRSASTFTTLIQLLGKAGEVKSGSYYFGRPQSLEEIITRITTSNYGLPTKTVTLFEGEANYQYAKRLSQEFENIDEATFIDMAREKEGFLFPDTYNIPLKADELDVIKKLEDNFAKRTKSLEEAIAASPYTKKQIITMASLVETEAGNASYETKQRVAGVLWKRIDIDMLLQADAVFSYIYQQHLPRVLFRHLEVESPYNVYKNKGLPPGPIANPGLDSIRATLEPVNPEGYLYYLTGNDGNFYYAKTLARHEQNRRNYLQY